MFLQRTRVYGRENVPKGEGLIFVSNHISNLDPPFLGSMPKQRVLFLAKQELFEARFLSWLLPLIGQIPVARGKGGSKALKEAAKILKKKFASIGIFPEGTRSKSGQPFELEPHTGFLVLGKLSGAPMIPVKLSGTWEALPPSVKFPRRTDCKIHFGKPLDIDFKSLDLKDREALRELAHKVMLHIDSLDRED